MNPIRIVPGSDFLLLWVLLTTLGYVIGFFAGFVLGHIVLGNVAIGVGLGAVVGIFQWLVLRRYLQRSGLWIIASMIGLFVGLGLYGIASLIWHLPFDLGIPYGALGYASAFLVGGLLIGLMQQVVLRRYVSRSGRWIWMSAIGWAASVIGLAVPSSLLDHGPAGVISATIIGGIILGVITAIGLKRLFK